MSHLQYFDYPGFGERAKQHLNSSQAVRIGNRIEISGQGISHPAFSSNISLTSCRWLESPDRRVPRRSLQRSWPGLWQRRAYDPACWRQRLGAGVQTSGLRNDFDRRDRWAHRSELEGAVQKSWADYDCCARDGVVQGYADWDRGICGFGLSRLVILRVNDCNNLFC